jgi:hypothetical protein
MDAALAASAALMGLAGAPHCAAMCGAAYGSLAARGPGAAFAPATLALHAGRAGGYAIAGAVVAGGVSALGGLQVAAPLLRPLWAMVHVAAIVFGVALLLRGRMPAFLARVRPQAARWADAPQPIRWLGRLPAPARAGLVGACWAGMPCGLLQSALLVAALASTPFHGAAVMAGFALASAPGLWLGPLLWRRLAYWRGSLVPRREPAVASPGAGGGVTAAGAASVNALGAAWSVRLAGALLAGASAFALWHGLGATIDAICGSAL